MLPLTPKLVRMVGFEPTLSAFSALRLLPLVYIRVKILITDNWFPILHNYFLVTETIHLRPLWLDSKRINLFIVSNRYVINYYCILVILIRNQMVAEMGVEPTIALSEAYEAP